MLTILVLGPSTAAIAGQQPTRSGTAGLPTTSGGLALRSEPGMKSAQQHRAISPILLVQLGGGKSLTRTLRRTNNSMKTVTESYIFAC